MTVDRVQIRFLDVMYPASVFGVKSGAFVVDIYIKRRWTGLVVSQDGTWARVLWDCR